MLWFCYQLHKVTTCCNGTTKKTSYPKRKSRAEGAFPLRAPRSSSPPRCGDPQIAIRSTWWTGHESTTLLQSTMPRFSTFSDIDRVPTLGFSNPLVDTRFTLSQKNQSIPLLQATEEAGLLVIETYTFLGKTYSAGTPRDYINT